MAGFVRCNDGHGWNRFHLDARRTYAVRRKFRVSMAARPGRPSVGSLPGFFSRANDKRLRGRCRPGLARRRPARCDRHADEPHSRERADRAHRCWWPLRVADRPARHLHAPGRASGFQDAGTDEPRRQRERQAFNRVVDARNRRGVRRSQRDESRDLVANQQR